jgi:hypothetical protein
MRTADNWLHWHIYLICFNLILDFNLFIKHLSVFKQSNVSPQITYYFKKNLDSNKEKTMRSEPRIFRLLITIVR